MKTQKGLFLGGLLLGALLLAGLMQHDVLARPNDRSPLVGFPATQTLTAGQTIQADVCNGVKRVTSATSVTTDTTDTFTAPSSNNVGCCMDVLYVGTNNLTLDDNSHNTLPSNVILGANGSIRVCSDGSKWRMVGRWTEF